MTVPQEYVHASRDFDRFMDDFMQIAMLETHHRSYAILRAIFVENWHPVAEPPPFPDRATLTQEVKAVRRDHNLASEASISEVAAALRRNVSNADLDRVLATLPAGAVEYWTP